MQTVVRSKVIKGNRAHLKTGMKVYLDSHEIQSDDVADNETETETASPKDLVEDEIEFMHRAGIFDEDSYGFFRHRISIAYNLSRIGPRSKKKRAYLTHEGGTLVRKEINYSYVNGAAIQYHLGMSFIRSSDWRGNPLLGANLLLDGSLASGRNENIQSIGLGAELHFFWVFKAAVGYRAMRSKNRIFHPFPVYYLPGQSLPVKDSMRTQG